MTNPREERYAEELGAEALARQRQLAKDHFKCCGEHKSGPHHESCKNFVEDAPPSVIEGQETLI